LKYRNQQAGCKKEKLVLPSREGRAFLIQSVKWRTKSKKKSASGTEMTLSAILTNREKPSLDLRFRRWAMLAQKSLARVLESTSKAWYAQGSGKSATQVINRLNVNSFKF
jgi:hypothetical protein